MVSNSKKSIIFKSFSFVFCAMMFAFAMVLAGNITESKAALNYCVSGTAMYVQDDGGCDLGDWNSMSVSSNASSYQSPQGSYKDLNGVIQAQVKAANSSYHDNSLIRILYVPINTVVTYGENNNCTSKKYVYVNAFANGSSTIAQSSKIDSNGATVTLTGYGTFLFEFYGTEKCNIVNSGSATFYSGAAIMYIVATPEYASSNSIAVTTSTSTSTHPTDGNLVVGSTSVGWYRYYLSVLPVVGAYFQYYTNTSNSWTTYAYYKSSTFIGAASYFGFEIQDAFTFTTNTKYRFRMTVYTIDYAYSAGTNYNTTGSYVTLYSSYFWVDVSAPSASNISGGGSSWATSRTLSIANASDSTAGLASSAYCFLSSSSTTNPGYSSCSWQSSSSRSYTSTTNTYVHGYVRDAVGNVKYCSYQQVKVDKTAPTASNISGGSSSWATSRTLSIASGADANSGLHSTPYCFISSSSTTAPGSGSCSWQSSSSKSYTSTTNTYVHGYIKDAMGNTAYKSYAQVKVDKTVPSANNISGGSSSWATSRTLSIASGSDSHSGLHSSAYCFISSSSTTAPGTGSCSWQSSASKSYTTTVNTYVHGYIRDAMGNYSYKSYAQVKVDNGTLPTYTSFTGGSSSWVYTSNLSVNGAADANSGLHSSAYCFVTATSTTAPGTGSCSWQATATKSITTQTNTYYHAYIRDAVGNVKHAGYQQVKVDRTAPVASGVTVTNSRAGWGCSSISITLSGASDSHSGFGKYQYSYDKSTWYNDWSGTATAASTVGTWSAARNATVYFRVVDAVGNVASVSATTTVKIDCTAPVVSSVTVTNSNTNWTNQNVTITIKGATDASSGMNRYQYSYDNSSWSNFDTTATSATEQTGTWSGERNSTIYFRAVDNAGNVAKVSKTTTIKIDKTAPTATISDKTIASSYINLSARTVTVPFNSLSDAASGLKSITATNSLVSGQNGTCSTTSKSCVFSFAAIKDSKIKFSFTVTDNAGNTKTDSAVTITVSPSLDDIAASLKSLLNSKLSKTVSGAGTTQLKYTLNADSAAIINDLPTLGLSLSDKAALKYIFVVDDLSSATSSQLEEFKDIAKSTTVAKLKSSIASPLGIKNEVVSLVLFIGDQPFYINKAQIGKAAAATLSTAFDTYSSEETTYLGAGLGEDGTVVSFSDDATSSMAVTLGASNTIEKRDVYGVLEWERAITSSGKIELKKVINNEYGILVLGETTSGSINGTSYPLKGGKDILVIRLDKAGNILFTNVIGTNGNDSVISGDMNDNRIAIISSVNENEGSLITMNVDGTGLDIKPIESTKLNLTSVAINANKIVVAGTTESDTLNGSTIGNVGNKDAFIQLYVDNNLSWTRRLGSTLNDTFYSVSLDNSNIYVVGQSEAAILHDNLGSTKMLDVYGEKDSLLVKYDYEGNMNQISAVGGEDVDTFNQILVTSDKVIIAGKSGSVNVTASHAASGSLLINKLSHMDTVIITMDKDLIIEEGLNLNGDEADLVQEIGINQYTEQLMILSTEGVHTQKVVESTLDFDVTYINGVLKVKANEEIVNATAFNGTNYYEIGNGIELEEGVYEIKVTSASGQTYSKNYTVEIGMTPIATSNNIIPMISLFVSILTLSILSILVIKKYKKEIKIA